jgi:uncharacterized membrane protein YqjE
METPPETDSNLADATKRVVWRLMAIGHNRIELLMVEIQEERERARIVIALAAAMIVLGLLAGITVTAVIACAAGEHYLVALIILAILYSGGALLLYFKLSNLKQQWELLAGTREQLEKDRACFDKTLT